MPGRTSWADATARMRWRTAGYDVSEVRYPADPWTKKELDMALLLWIIAVILVIAGIVSLVRGEMLWGAVLIIVGLAVGPGGYSIFNR